MRQNRRVERKSKRHSGRRLTAENLEQRSLMAVLGLASGVVKADGRVVELTFTGPLDTATTSTPDWETAVTLGKHVSLSNGTELEPIGTIVTKDATTLTWTSSFLITDASQVVTQSMASVSIQAAAGYLADPEGNTTSALNNVLLVNHSMVDADGFTSKSFQNGTGGVTIYVSSTYGDDSYTVAQATSPLTPMKTADGATNALRKLNMNGKGVTVRFLRGDTFSGGLNVSTLAGQDRTHPSVFEDYWYQYTPTATDPGTRPLFTIDASKGQFTGLGSINTALNDMVIRNLSWTYINTTNIISSNSGTNLLSGGTNWVIDNCTFSDFTNNANIQGWSNPFGEFTVLRSVFTDAHMYGTTAMHSAGTFVGNTSDILISQSTYDRNGKLDATLTNGDIFSHNIYINLDSGPGTVWGNVISDAGAQGIWMKSGGIAAYNYLVGNPSAMTLGSNGGAAVNNVIEAADDISPTEGYGWGISISRGFETDAPLTVAVIGNLVLHANTFLPTNSVFVSTYESKSTDAVIDVLIRNNTSFGGGRMNMVKPEGATGTIRAYHNIVSNPNKVTLTGSAISDTSWLKSDWNVVNTAIRQLQSWQATMGADAHTFTQEISFVNGTADAGSYSASRGGPTSTAGFLAAARARATDSWLPLLNTADLYAYFLQQYTPTNLPIPGDSATSHYGAADYSAPKVDPPTDLAATAADPGVITLTWQKASDLPVTYTLYRGTTPGADTVYQSGLTQTTYTDSDVTPGVTYYYRVRAVAIQTGMESNPTDEVSSVYNTTPSSNLDFSSGFTTGTTTNLTLNGASLNNLKIRLTDGRYQARSVFSSTRQSITAFSTSFSFQIAAGTNIADGLTFTIQNTDANAVGAHGVGLGYGTNGSAPGIKNSLAITFDLFNNASEGNNSTGVYTNGAMPTQNSTTLTGSGIDLHSGHIMKASIGYDGSTLRLTLTDTATDATFTRTFTGYDIPAIVGGTSAYVGFTGGTGGYSAVQDILTWQFSNSVTPPGEGGPVDPPDPQTNVPINFPSGFESGSSTGIVLNGASIQGSKIRLTDARLQARSVFSSTRQTITGFNTNFSFQIGTGVNVADGFTFTIQNNASTVVGPNGLGLGYGTNGAASGIGNSLAIKFDIYNNSGEGDNSTGVYVDGQTPTLHATTLAGSGIDLHSGHVMEASIGYDGSDLTLSITDTATGAEFTKTFTGYNIPAIVGGTSAYVGFTGSTGGYSAIQDILSWTYQPTTTQTQVSLQSAFNTTGLTTDGSSFSNALAYNGMALSTYLLSTSVLPWSGTLLQLGTPNTANMITAMAQTIALPSSTSYSTLKLAGFAVGTPQQNQTFTVTYTDGTTSTASLSLSQWQDPQNYQGETSIMEMPYVNTANGSRITAKTFIYGYSIALDPTRRVASLTLPYNVNVRILAATLVS